MALLTLLAAWTVAVMSPGPDFLAVLRTAAAQGRRAGLLVALGVVTGIGCWAGLALTGLALLLARYAQLYVILRVVGALFLLGYGLHIVWTTLRSRPDAAAGPSAPADAPLRRRGHAYRLGLATNLANPKAVVFFGALFATLLPPHLTVAGRVGVVAAMLAIALAWFAIVAAAAGAPAVMRGYRRVGRRIDLVAGGAFAAVGVALLPR